MNLTDNALRKLQQEGLFAIGPTQQSPPNSTKPAQPDEDPPTTEPENEKTTSDEEVVPMSNEPTSESASNSGDAVRWAAPSRTEPTGPQITEPVDPSLSSSTEPSGDQRSAYDPVIPSFDGPPLAESDPPSWTEQQPDTPQTTPLDSADIKQRIEEAADLAEWMDDGEATAPDADRNHSSDENELLETIAPFAASDSLKVAPEPDLGDLDEPKLDNQELTIAWEEVLPTETATETATETETDTEPDAERAAHVDVECDPMECSKPKNAELQTNLSNKLPETNTATYEQTVLGQLIHSDYALPFLRFQDELLRRSGTDLPGSLLAVSPEATSRSAETLCHLALMWKRPHEEILLVDANLEEQTLTRAFQAVGHLGLCDILTQNSCTEDLVRCTQQAQLHFIPCGDDRTGLSRVPGKLDPEFLREILDTFCRQYDRVFIDVGPITAALAAPFAEACDASILVVSARNLALPQLQNAADALRKSSRRVLGCVVTDQPSGLR